MTSIIAEITNRVARLKGCQFASLTYLSKKAGELARYNVNLGFTYVHAVKKSITELEILMDENETTWNPTQKAAAKSLMRSFKETLVKHAQGRQNSAYTKQGQYIPIRNGANVNSTDNTIQLFGLVNSKVILHKGYQKPVNSSQFTIERNKLRKQLTVSRFREFAVENIQEIKTAGVIVKTAVGYR